MIKLLIACAVLLALVLWLLIRGLRQSTHKHTASHSGSNLALYKEQLHQLDADLVQARITPAEHEAAVAELQERAFADGLADQSAATDTPLAPEVDATTASLRAARCLALGVAIGVPVMCSLLYLLLGSPLLLDTDYVAQLRAQALAQSAPVAGPMGVDPASVSPDQIKAMVAQLAQKQQANPDNLPGWLMLAQSYTVLGDLKGAEHAYRQAMPLVEQDPRLLTALADVIAKQAKNQLAGEPTALINKAFSLNPNDAMTLVMLGASHFQAGADAQAVQVWERLLARLEPGSEGAIQIQAQVDLAKARQSTAAPKP